MSPSLTAKKPAQTEAKALQAHKHLLDGLVITSLSFGRVGKLCTSARTVVGMVKKVCHKV